MANKKRRWLRVALRAVLMLLMFLAALAVAGKLWIIPAVVRWQVNSALSNYWDGRAEIDQVEFSLTKPIYLRGFSVLDSAGRQWLHIDALEFSLANWPSMSPILTNVKVDRPTINLYYEDGRCNPPIRRPPEDRKSDLDKYVELESVTVSDVSIAQIYDNGEDRVHQFFQLDVKRKGSGYLVSGGDDDGEIRLAGLLTPEGEKKFSGQIAFFVADLPKLQRALQGKSKMASGTGTVQLAFTSQGTDMETLRGRGAVFLDDVDFSRYRLINSILGFIGISSAKLIGSSDVEGVFRIEGPVMVLESGCHLSNRLAAIEAEPGGTINVRTKEIDIYIVAGQFREIRHILTSLPLLGVPLADPVNLVSHLLNKLFRLHLKGKWDDPPTKLIREEPLTNIGTGTTEFFRGAVKTGGQLGPGVLEMFSDLIKPRENNDKKNQ